jgi:uncharacterized protein (DUF58 family)
VSPPGERAQPLTGLRRALFLVILGTGLFGIARTTGSGWMIVICSGLVAVLAIAALWPALALRGITLGAVTPRDATVGRPLDVAITASAGWRQSSLLVRSVEPESSWARALLPCAGELAATPSQRGVVHQLDIELRSGAPLGLFSWRRHIGVPLARPLEVGPAPAVVPFPKEILAGAPGGDPQPRARVGLDLVRGVRDYVSGDPARLVHWPATAHRGELVVKELEDPDRPSVAIVVDLRGPKDGAELAASRAAGLAGEVLATGMPVVLLTAERSGGVAGPVASALEVGRRLARAVAKAPAEGPIPPGAVVIRMVAR